MCPARHWLIKLVCLTMNCVAQTALLLGGVAVGRQSPRNQCQDYPSENLAVPRMSTHLGAFSSGEVGMAEVSRSLGQSGAAGNSKEAILVVFNDSLQMWSTFGLILSASL